MMVQQQQLMKLALEQGRARSSSSQNPLTLLAGGTGDLMHDRGHAGIRGVAARQLLLENPKHHQRMLAATRSQLAKARRTRVEELAPGDLYKHMQETVPFGSGKLLTYAGFMAAAM